MSDALTQLITIVGSFVVGGGLVSFLSYLGNRETNKANAQKTVGGAWQIVVEELRHNQQELRKDYDALKDKYEELEGTMHQREEANKTLLETRNSEIASLKRRVTDLENELAGYRKLDEKLEMSKEALHQHVEEDINAVKSSVVV